MFVIFLEYYIILHYFTNYLHIYSRNDQKIQQSSKKYSNQAKNTAIKQKKPVYTRLGSQLL